MPGASEGRRRDRGRETGLPFAWRRLCFLLCQERPELLVEEAADAYESFPVLLRHLAEQTVEECFPRPVVMPDHFPGTRSELQIIGAAVRFGGNPPDHIVADDPVNQF